MLRRERIKNVKGLGVIVMQFGRLWYVLYMSCAALPAGPGLPSGPARVYMEEEHVWNWNIWSWNTLS